MLKGEAVWNYTVMFLDMWNAFRPEDYNYERFRPHVWHPEPFDGTGYIQPYGDTPLDNETTGENVYLNIINQAQKYVYIFTPYLIVDHDMVTALTLAAKRQVDVRIITPGIPDKKAVFLLTQSYYEGLIRYGVKIYEYTPGFVQALMAIQVLSVFSYRLYVRHQMVATIMRICQQDWLIILNLDMRIFMIGTMQFLILIPS